VAEFLEWPAPGFQGQMPARGAPYSYEDSGSPFSPDRIEFNFSTYVDGGNNLTGLRLASPIPCPADLAPPSGALDVADFSVYLDHFQSADSAADLAEPFGVVNFFDLAAYLNAFHAGCP